MSVLTKAANLVKNKSDLVNEEVSQKPRFESVLSKRQLHSKALIKLEASLAQSKEEKIKEWRKSNGLKLV